MSINICQSHFEYWSLNVYFVDRSIFWCDCKAKDDFGENAIDYNISNWGEVLTLLVKLVKSKPRGQNNYLIFVFNVNES